MGLVLVAVVTLICGTIQSMVGFGYNILFMALIPIFIPYNEAILVCLFGALLSCTVNLIPRFKKARVKYIIPALISYFVAAALATSFVDGLDVSILRRGLGLLLFALAIFFIFFSSHIKIRGTVLNGIIAGLLSGAGGGAFAINGPPIGIYMLSVLNDKEEYMATTQAYFIIAGIYTIAVKLITTGASVIILSHTAVVLLATAAGVLAGIKINDKLNEKAVKMCVYIFMGLSGLWILIGG